MVLIAVGLIWDSVRLGEGTKRVLFWLWSIAVVGNWVQTLTAAIVGGTHFMPIASWSDDSRGRRLSAVIVIVSIDAVVAVSMTIWGLRGRDQ